MERVASVAAKLKPYFDSRLRKDGDNDIWSMYDDELGDAASCCTTAAAASFYVLDAELHGGDGLEKAARLARDVRRRQLPEGAFGQPYYVKKGETGTVDIAEIGASATSLYRVYRAAGEEAAKDSLLRSADYLLTQVAAENPGAVYKNPNAKSHDVLNGDIYAAHTLGRAYELSGDDQYLRKAEEIVVHVMSRFGKHSPGWWPYTENWDGTVHMGNSVAYQATIIAFAHSVIPLLSPSVRRSWAAVASEAVDTIIEALKQGPNDDNEAPWWCRDWDNVPEILLALACFPEREEARAYVERRLRTVDEQLERQGISVFEPKVKHDDPERSPVTTTYRKAATFAAILGHLTVEDVLKQDGEKRGR
jgi:hypothetical protein